MVQQCGEIANKYTQTLKWNVNVAWLYQSTYEFIFSYSQTSHICSAVMIVLTIARQQIHWVPIFIWELSGINYGDYVLLISSWILNISVLFLEEFGFVILTQL